LLVDDEPKNLVALSTILDDPRYQLVQAVTADEALLALVKEEFALIILDIHMPGMSGFELAQLIKQRKKTACVPIIFLTAYYSEDQHVLEGYETGAVDYLHKPINPAILRSKVSVFAELHLKSREIAAANSALTEEVTERRRVQQELVRLNEDLEQRVEQRTQDLLQTNLALRNSEERLRQAQSAGGVGVWDWQTTTGEIWWSDSMWAIYGVKPVPTREVQRLWRTLIHPDDRERVEAQWAKLMADGEESSLRDEFRILCPAGEVRWVESVARLERSPSGQTVRMLGVNVDVSDRKRMEQELRQIASELSESDRRKDQFLAMLAHELRNPLAPIRNAVEILRLMPGDTEAVKAASTLMDRQIAQMVRLVDDLLDVSRISRGKIELRLGQVELISTVSEVLESMRPLAESKGQSLTSSLPNARIHLSADSTRLAQLIGNLLNNACKFTPPGGRISLDVTQENNEAVVRVVDNGIGIPPEQLATIFEMFVQGDTSLERAQSGLGIGLTLVRQLAEMHGGAVEARSGGKGQGAEFLVRLPIQDQSPQNESGSPRNTSDSRKSFGRILVVDDNRDAAQSLARLLEVQGNTTMTAFDGVEALEAGAAFEPDVVLLDIGLPRLNGYDAARQIRQEPWGRDVALIALTGWGKDEDRRRSSEAGFDKHLVKPVQLDELNSLLQTLLET
jgi:PAS domain S-box-containing protein